MNQLDKWLKVFSDNFKTVKNSRVFYLWRNDEMGQLTQLLNEIDVENLAKARERVKIF